MIIKEFGLVLKDYQELDLPSEPFALLNMRGSPVVYAYADETKPEQRIPYEFIMINPGQVFDEKTLDGARFLGMISIGHGSIFGSVFEYPTAVYCRPAYTKVLERTLDPLPNKFDRAFATMQNLNPFTDTKVHQPEEVQLQC